MGSPQRGVDLPSKGLDDGERERERPLEVTVDCAGGRFDVAVLLLRGDLGRAWLHAEVPHDREVVLVEQALAGAGGVGVGDDALEPATARAPRFWGGRARRRGAGRR
jgi:hypothetical protein